MTVQVTNGQVALRYLRIMGLFADRKRWTTGELSERLAVTPRQVEKDLLYLSTEPLYVPLDYDDEERSWSVPADWRPRL
jgi:predicted DNA-binding transcriptional regulator YafY